jgi:hypothetical protein
MHANDARSTAALRHGAYLCFQVPAAARPAVARAPVEAVADRLRFQGEFHAEGGDPPDAIAFLRRVSAAPGHVDDERLLGADAIVHVASASPERVAELCAEVMRLLPHEHAPHVLAGVVRPAVYTGNAMHDYAYAHRVLQQPGAVMPNAFLVPTRKTAAWWAKGWMERHTYILPRYDDAGRMLHEGHALAASAGIACLLRRTYKSAAEPAPAGAYDFINYFECADADVPTFHAVCAALRDTAKNPEWRFVEEGPSWHGRRVATWRDLFA